MDDNALAIGTNVLAPWGLDMVEGEIVGLYGPPSRRQVVVHLFIPGFDEDPDEATTSFSAADLRRVGPSGEIPTAGSWVFEWSYEEQVRTALRKIFSSSAPFKSALKDLDIRYRGTSGDSGLDFAVSVGRKLIFIEAKKARSDGTLAESTLAALLGRFEQAAISAINQGKEAAALLISDGELSKAGASMLENWISSGLRLRFVRWDGSSGDAELRKIVRELSGSPH